MTSYGRGEFDGFSSYQAAGGRGNDGGSEFSRLSNTIGSNIQKITQNVSQIQRLVSQIGTAQDSNEIRDRVHQLTHYTHQLAKETNTDLKAFSRLHVAPSEQSKWKMQKDRYTEEFSNALTNFQTTQRTAAEKEKASVARARAHSSTRSPYEDDTNDDFATPGFSQTKQVLQMEEDVDLEMIQERENAIKQLERDITDVNQIFKDLGMLVHEQGDMLDSIEANVETAQIQVHEGNKQLASAATYQVTPEELELSVHETVSLKEETKAEPTDKPKECTCIGSKARRKKCICLVIVLVVIAVVAIILIVTLKK